MKKFSIAISSVLLVVVVGCATLGLCIGWPSIQAAFTGKQLGEINQQTPGNDHLNSYADNLIVDLGNILEKNTVTVADLNHQIADLKASGTASAEQLSELTVKVSNLETVNVQLRDQLDALKVTNDLNSGSITELRSIMDDLQSCNNHLQSQLEELRSSDSINADKIASLQSNLSELNAAINNINTVLNDLVSTQAHDWHYVQGITLYESFNQVNIPVDFSKYDYKIHLNIAMGNSTNFGFIPFTADWKRVTNCGHRTSYTMTKKLGEAGNADVVGYTFIADSNAKIYIGDTEYRDSVDRYSIIDVELNYNPITGGITWLGSLGYNYINAFFNETFSGYLYGTNYNILGDSIRNLSLVTYGNESYTALKSCTIHVYARSR